MSAALRAGEGTVRVLVAAALAVDAVVHLRLAADYQLAYPDGIGGGNLFRVEAAVALLAALYVLLRGSRPAYSLAFLVAISAFLAVVVSRYVQIPSIGPIPSLYEPLWFFEKTLSAVAEGAGAVLAAVGFALAGRCSATRSATGAPSATEVTR